MKISVIITTILVVQVSASFFDVFHGAVLSVQNSFGKLLSDVVTDVKETVDCTILAVEHVLSLSNDATTRYYDKCSSGTNKTDSVSEVPQDAIVPKVEVTLNLPNEEFLQKVIPAEIDARIDEKLSKILGNYKPHDDALNIQNVLAKESEQLAGVSGLVKKELEKLANEVSTDIKKIEKERESQPSVDTILQEINILEKRERNTKNPSEAKEIHQEIDQVLGKLNAIKATEVTENVKLEEILIDLENNSNNSFVGLRHQIEEWKEEESKHLNEIKSKIDEHEKISAHHHLSHRRHGSDQIQPILFNTDLNIDVEYISSSSEIFSKYITLGKDVLNNSTSSRTIADGNEKFLITVADDNSFPENKKLEDSSSDTVTTNYPLFNNKSSVETEVIYPIETLTVVGSSELSPLSTNEPNNLTGDDTKLTTSIATLITESTLDYEKQHTLPTHESSLSPGKKKSIQSVIPIQTLKITEIEDETPFDSNTDDYYYRRVILKEESANTVTKPYTDIEETEVTEMISTSQNNNNSEAVPNSSTPDQVVEYTSKNSPGPENEALTILSSYELTTAKVVVTFDDNQLADTMITSTSPAITADTSVIDTIIPIENGKNSGNDKFVTATSAIVYDDSNDTKVMSTFSSTVENSQVSEIIPIEIETTTFSSKEESSTTVVYDNNTTDIIKPSASLPIVENTPVLGNIQTDEIETNSSNDTTISSNSLPFVENITFALKVTAVSGNEESIIANTLLPIVENSPLSDSIGETTAVSNYEEATEAVTALKTTLKIENDSYITVTSTHIPYKNILEGETTDAKATTTVFSGEEESLDSNAIETSITGDVDSSEVAESENDNTLTWTTNSPIASPATSADNDSDTDFIIGTMITIQEITTGRIIIELENTTPPENEDPLNISKSPTNEITESYPENTGSGVVTETIQTVETFSATKEQTLSSTSTQFAIKGTRSTIFPLTEIISESTMTSKNDLDLRNSTTVESNASSEMSVIPDLNDMIRSASLGITNSPPENREWLTLNKLKQIYDTYTVPRNDDINAPISLRDPSSQTRQPFVNPDVPYGMPLYGESAIPPIARGAFNEAQRQAEAFAIFESIDKRLSHSESPFGPEDDIPIANIPPTPLLANIPWKPIEPQRMNFENSFVPPLQPIRPLPFDDMFPGKVYRPQGLTTHRPRIANYYKNPSIDYDSFFHSPRNSEAHQRALKQARQIMANSKQSERIINNVMQNKDKFNTRTIFNG